MLVYWRVVHQDVDPQSVNLGVQVESFRWKTKKNHISLVANREDDPWYSPRNQVFCLESLRMRDIFFFKFHPITCFSFFCLGFLNIFKPIMKKKTHHPISHRKTFDRGEVAPELVSAAILWLVSGGNRTCHCEPCGFQVCTGSRGDRTAAGRDGMDWDGMGWGICLEISFLNLKVGY